MCSFTTIMELSHSLTLNEEALAQIPVAKRPVFIFEWLRFLDKVLVAAQKVGDISVLFPKTNNNYFIIYSRRMILGAVRRSWWNS